MTHKNTQLVAIYPSPSAVNEALICIRFAGFSIVQFQKSSTSIEKDSSSTRALPSSTATQTNISSCMTPNSENAAILTQNNQVVQRSTSSCTQHSLGSINIWKCQHYQKHIPI